MSKGYAFSQVPVADIPRSSFNRSHSHKTTFDAGFLVPIFVDEGLPGDTFNLRASLFARLATPIFPLMDNLYLDVFFFAVPNRLLWNNWQKFMGEQENPGDSTDFLVPQVEPTSALTGFGPDTIFDYFGVPTGAPGITCSALFARAYNLIWNEWFRDQNLQDSVVVNKDDGPDVESEYVYHVTPGFPTGYSLAKRGKRHDYFTSCLPWPQKGPGVLLPLGDTAPVIGNNVTPSMEGVTSGTDGNIRAVLTNVFPGMSPFSPTTQFTANEELRWVNTGMVADLEGATAATINSLRQAFQLQRLLERDARGGTRYVELIKSHFGVTSPDARLQRPEFLGGGSIPVIVNPVTQTSSTDATTPQGNLAAYGVAGGRGIGFTKSFVEHCVILGLVCARADLSYQQGLPRMFSRRTRYDFYWPALAHLGEQAVLAKEIYAYDQAHLDTVFGYQERWAEYRYAPSKITGAFRSSIAASLDAWHLAQEFGSRPVLSDEFIQESPPVDRVIAVESEPHFLFDSHFSLKCARPMPMYSVPGLIDHF